jgi:hypothetical protein
MSERFDEQVANAVLGTDTLWGGDVMNPSGLGRFIADSWFSDAPLPLAYTHPAAARVRESGGVSAKEPDRAAIETYLAAVDVRGAIAALGTEAKGMSGLRGRYVAGLALCFDVMWDLAMEILGKGEPVPYGRCVLASTGLPPTPSDPAAKRRQVQELLARAGHPSASDADLLAAVDAWRGARYVPMASVRSVGGAYIAHYRALAERNLRPFLPGPLGDVPMDNIEFLPIKDAWFSGSMNYLGRKRRPGGRPEYEASYEINASLQITVPEFEQLVSHEVVPGHVTTFAFLQDLFWRKQVGFEASVLTMNTRAATLFEGIANNAILIAYGVTELEQIPDDDLKIGLLLALLQDDAKNQASYLTWKERKAETEVAPVLRRDFLISEERAGKFAGAWGKHPLLGRMYLPCYRAGTDLVADLRRRHAPGKLLPVLYGCAGLVDCTTIEEALAANR